MLIRPCAEFCADFPDDMIEEDGEVVQFGGRVSRVGVTPLGHADDLTETAFVGDLQA